MRIRPALVAALLAAGLLALPAAPVLTRAAAAQEKDKDKDKDKDKEKKEKEEKERKEREKKKRREKAIREIGDNFGSKNTSWLLNRVPKEQKLTLCLASDKGDVDYSLDQARSVLQRFFDDVQILSVETTSEDAKLTETGGSFPMSYRRAAEKQSRSATLYVTISGVDSTQNGQLTKLSVELR